MAVDNPFTITYGALAVGGTSDTLLLHGPYVIDKTYTSLRLVFDVIVVASSYSTLQSLSDSVETGFDNRDVNLTIDLDGSSWTYTSGSTILNTRASCQKAGDPQTDRGYSRAYTVVVQGDLPAEDNDGLRDLEVHVDYSSARQKTVTMRGVYTATSSQSTATAAYSADFDGEASTLLTAIDSGATFELVSEETTQDRNNHTAGFQRQYVELLANQSTSTLDDTDIRDHSLTFTELLQHPGDSNEAVDRLRRVIGNYACSIDIDQTTDVQGTYTSKIRPHVITLFQSTFSPGVFAVEDERVSYDETAKRMSVALQLIYQKAGGDDVVEITHSTTMRESRQIDYTPVHNGNEYGAYADPGWGVRERVTNLTAIYVGEPTGQGFLDDVVSRTGWNTVSRSSQITPQWIGDPTSDAQMQTWTVTEQQVDRWNEAPSGGDSSGGGFVGPGGDRG